MAEALEEISTLEAAQSIQRVVASPGSCLFEVECANGLPQIGFAVTHCINSRNPIARIIAEKISKNNLYQEKGLCDLRANFRRGQSEIRNRKVQFFTVKSHTYN